MPGTLAGVRILDLSLGIAGPFCTRLLADLGADVVKVEPPHGDPTRRFLPYSTDEPLSNRSLIFTALNVNKMGITLNFETANGRDILRRLVENCDVLVESFHPGFLDNLGVGWSNLSEANPRLVMTSITPFGQTGPYSSYVANDIALHALSGVMSYSGNVDRPPIKHGGFQYQYEGGLNGAAATTVALLFRERFAQGQHVDVSILHSLTATAVQAQAMYAFNGGILGRRDERNASSNVLGRISACADGYVVVQTPDASSWRGLATLLDEARLLEPPYSDPHERPSVAEELDEILAAALKKRTRRELFEGGSKLGVLVGIVQTPADIVESEQLERRSYFADTYQPDVGTIRLPSRLVKMSESSMSIRRPAPLLGQHNQEIYGSALGFSRKDLDVLAAIGVV